VLERSVRTPSIMKCWPMPLFIASTAAPFTARIPRGLEVTSCTAKQCEGDLQIASFDPGAGHPAEWCRGVAQRLAAGQAAPQLVGQLKEAGSGDLLAMTTVMPQGRPVGENVHPCIREISVLPYVNMLARSASHCDCVLCDGSTRLGTMLVRVAVELGHSAVETPDPPAMWAMVAPDNVYSRRAFERYGFERWPPELTGCDDDVMIRRAGKSLPPRPDESTISAVVQEISVRRTPQIVLNRT
jgi:hypothetical protein